MPWPTMIGPGTTGAATPIVPASPAHRIRKRTGIIATGVARSADHDIRADPCGEGDRARRAVGAGTEQPERHGRRAAPGRGEQKHLSRRSADDRRVAGLAFQVLKPDVPDALHTFGPNGRGLLGDTGEPP